MGLAGWRQARRAEAAIYARAFFGDGSDESPTAGGPGPQSPSAAEAGRRAYEAMRSRRGWA